VNLTDNLEWSKWSKLFSSYQVIGMRLEVQLISGQSIAGTVYAGQTAGVPLTSLSSVLLQGMPLSKRVSQDGSVTSLYYPF